MGYGTVSNGYARAAASAFRYNRHVFDSGDLKAHRSLDPHGLSYREAHLAMETIADSHQLVSMDVVEVNPILDRENATALLAVELVLSALGKKIL